MRPVERNAWTDDLHVSRAIMPQRLARAERDAVLAFQNHLLFEQKLRQLHVGRELETQRADDIFEEISQRILP
jgi:hypothetical protein